MTIAELHSYNSIDLYPDTPAGSEAARIADLTEEMATLCMIFSQIERVPRYTPERRENNCEHSYMVAMVAMEVAASFRPDLDLGLVSQFALVHDLPEVPERQDVPTFNLTEEEVAAKERHEHDLLAEFARTLPPHTASLLCRYETQEEPEARFVRHIDKLLPVAVDLLGQGCQVMEADYGIRTPHELAATESNLSAGLRRTFPDPELQVLHTARDIIAGRFALKFSLEMPAFSVDDHQGRQAS